MHRHDTLFLLGSLALMPLASLGAQAKDSYSINGIVRDEGGTPLSETELSLSRGGQKLQVFRTGENGRFNFTELRAGQLVLNVRRMGYKTISMNVEVGPASGATPVALQLEEIASDLPSILVEGSKGHLTEFYEHKASNNFAKFFERKDIEKRNPIYLSELLRAVAGASLYASERTGNRVLLRDCKPMVWVDGMRAPGAELDELARPMDVAGLEVYPSAAGLPPQYQDRSNRMCGAIVVWTRNQ